LYSIRPRLDSKMSVRMRHTNAKEGVICQYPSVVSGANRAELEAQSPSWNRSGSVSDRTGAGGGAFGSESGRETADLVEDPAEREGAVELDCAPAENRGCVGISRYRSENMRIVCMYSKQVSWLAGSTGEESVATYIRKFTSKRKDLAIEQLGLSMFMRLSNPARCSCGVRR